MRDDDEKPRFALLLAAKDSDYVKNVYGGYFNVFVAAFGEEKEENWDLFRVVEGDFPLEENLDKYEGFLISGSPYDAYGNELWILKLCSLIQALDSMRKKVLGICFGHQVICRALGGKVGKSYSGWDLGIRKVNIVNDNNNNNNNPILKNLFVEELDEIPSCISIIECHQDEVWEVPLGANVIAYSDKTGVEMFAIEDHILGIQGHPEYTKDILDNIIDRLLNTQSIEKDLAEEAKIVLKVAEPDRKWLEDICRKFLKRKIASQLILT